MGSPVADQWFADPAAAREGHGARDDQRDERQATEIAARFGLFRIDTVTRTISWSVGIAHIFGRPLPPGGSLGLDEHLEYYHADDRQAVRQRIEAAMAGGTPRAYLNRGRIWRPDGDLRELIAQGLVERNEQGRVVSLHGILVDLTETLRLERWASESNERLRTTLESIDQGIVMLGPDYRVRLHNRRACDLLDVPEALLAEGASFEKVLEFQEAAGEFVGVAEADRPRLQVDAVGLYERQRPNGAVLEVRTQPLADGGVVRTFSDVTDRERRKAALNASERRYRILAEHTSDVVIWCDLDSTRRYVSPASKNLFGYDPSELVGTRPLTFVHPEDAESFAAILDDLRSERIERAITRQRYRHKDGQYIWVEVSFNLVRDRDRRCATGWVAAVRDISERKAAEDALRLSEERLALALESGSDGFWECDLPSGLITFSGRWPSILGYDEADFSITLDAWRDRLHADDRARTLEVFCAHLRGATPELECEYRVETKSGGYIWAHARGRVVRRDGKGLATRIVGTHSDITKRKEAEAVVAYMAVHDALTGLPNRVLFKDRLQHVVREARQRRRKFAVFACDLDRFKYVNDSLGHSAGDKLLTSVASRLKSVVRDEDTIVRLGGDEFAVILENIDGPDEAVAAAERLIEAADQSFEIDGRSVSIGMSVGIVIGPDNGDDTEQLYKNADIALYRAKAAGRNSLCLFERGMDTLIAERSQLEQDMREALRNEGFALHYQPIVRLSDGSISGFEALLRWQHPSRGAIPPTEFVPIAEENGLIFPLGEWTLREACRQAAAWPGTRVAVNVSAVQFQQPEALKQSVLLALTQTGLPPEQLELEITEGVLMQNVEASIACLQGLRELGVRIALDDFGTGYSSLSYLKRFPFSRIKIDRSFVQDVEDPATAAIVRAVVWLAGRVGAAVTAEGVETREQLAQMRKAGCNEVQGFLFSRPLATERAVALMRAYRRRLAA